MHTKFFSVILLTVSLTLLLISCEQEKTIEFEVPFTDSSLVLYGFITPSEPISVQVNKTVPPIHDIPADDKVTDASVFLYENGNFIEELITDDGETYRSPSDFLPQAGGIYTVEVQASDYLTISGTDTIPAKVDLNIDGLVFNADSSNAFTTAYFADPASVKNYYGVRHEGYREGALFFGNGYSGEYSFEGNNNGCGGQGLYLPDAIKHGGGFSDICFDGEEVSFELNLTISGEGYDENWAFFEFNIERHIIRLYTHTHTLFKYSKSVSDYNDTFGDPFLEQAQTWSNIKNGYGVFCAYNQDSISINF